MSGATTEGLSHLLGARGKSSTDVHQRGKTVLCIPSLEGDKDIGATVTAAQQYVDRVLVTEAGSSVQKVEQARSAGAFTVGHTAGRGREEVMAELFKEAMALDPSFVVVMDLHRSNDPSFIPKLISPLIRRESDITVGVHEEDGVLALHANLFALNSRALSTHAGADFFKSMAAGDDHEIADVGLKLMAVFFDTSSPRLKPAIELKKATGSVGQREETYRFFRDDRPDALAMAGGVAISATGIVLMGWTGIVFLRQNYSNTILAVCSATLILAGMIVIVSSSLHSYLRRLSRR
ncbi:MAG TPA: hypothetical protein VMS77_09935 [Conexivisphaerales archaeon]|nr:hypothetical protein [Conexivisphaerales archaeon]